MSDIYREFDDLCIKISLERLLAEINRDKKLEINADIVDVSCETIYDVEGGMPVSVNAEEQPNEYKGYAG